MKKAKKVLKSTTSSLVYNAANKELHSDCDLCSWHSGCNRSNRLKGESSWKKYRKHQWK